VLLALQDPPLGAQDIQGAVGVLGKDSLFDQGPDVDPIHSFAMGFAAVHFLDNHPDGVVDT